MMVLQFQGHGDGHMKNWIGAAALAAMVVPAQAGSVAEAPPGVDPARFTKLPTYRYDSTFDTQGNLAVRLNVAKSAALNGNKVMRVLAPDVRETEQLLHQQDWYMVVGPEGRTHSIYTLPKKVGLPSYVLRTMGEGYGILKVNPRRSFFKVFPSPYELEAQLQAFTTATRDAVCTRQQRPDTLSASIDVVPGWAAAGRIRLNATWNVNKLCAPPSQVKRTGAKAARAAKAAATPKG